MKQQIVPSLLAVVALGASAGPAWADAFRDTFVVPEPASLLLFGTGAGAVLLVKRLRQRGKRR